MSEPLLTYRGSVYPSQCDQMGHLNVAFYVAKFDEATWQLLNAIGLAPTRMRTEKIGMAGVEQHIEYKRELYAGDVVTVTSRVLEIRDKSIRFQHEMRNDETGELAAQMVIVAVHLDTATRRARAFPADVRERVVAMIDAPRG
jgi:acyl-CoA thioester hydrolase